MRKLLCSFIRLIFIVALIMPGSLVALADYDVSLIVSKRDKIANEEPVQWAIRQLQKTLQAEGVDTQVRSQIQAVSERDRCVLIAGSTSKLAKAILHQNSISVPDTPEALGLLEGMLDGRPVLLACGSDTRGLVYAVLELADRIKCGIAPVCNCTLNNSGDGESGPDHPTSRSAQSLE